MGNILIQAINNAGSRNYFSVQESCCADNILLLHKNVIKWYTICTYVIFSWKYGWSWDISLIFSYSFLYSNFVICMVYHLGCGYQGDGLSFQFEHKNWGKVKVEGLMMACFLILIINKRKWELVISSLNIKTTKNRSNLYSWLIFSLFFTSEYVWTMLHFMCIVCFYL